MDGRDVIAGCFVFGFILIIILVVWLICHALWFGLVTTPRANSYLAQKYGQDNVDAYVEATDEDRADIANNPNIEKSLKLYSETGHFDELAIMLAKKNSADSQTVAIMSAGLAAGAMAGTMARK